MINISKKFLDNLETIVAVGMLIESAYKGDVINETSDKTVRMDDHSINGCNLYFKEASNNWYKSKLNLNLNRCS